VTNQLAEDLAWLEEAGAQSQPEHTAKARPSLRYAAALVAQRRRARFLEGQTPFAAARRPWVGGGAGAG